MGFEKGFEKGEGSGSERPVFKSMSDLLKNASSDSHLQSYEDELRKKHVMKLMQKLREEELKSVERKTGPTMEEFMPPKSSNYTETEGEAKSTIDLNEKKEWMSSTNLWNTPIEYRDGFNIPSQYQVERGSGLFKGGSAGAFAPYKKPIKDNIEGSTADVMTQAEPVRAAKEGKRGVAKPRTPKRQRRCWTPELHTLFVDALAKIGGAEAATPKHILEHMQVEGLTADEVKSHLQKFRIHVRKLASLLAETHVSHRTENGDDQAYED